MEQHLKILLNLNNNNDVKDKEVLERLFSYLINSYLRKLKNLKFK